jgi:hypothetical protein
VGLVISVTDIEDLLRGGREMRGFEIKGPGDRGDSRFFAKVARAALSLGNLRDGGYGVIGIEDANPASLGPGLDEAQASSWANSDEVARKLAVYADPPLDFELEVITLSSGNRVAAFRVHEFADLPHLCAKGYDDVLREGALYVRSRKLPETVEVASSVAMRDILDLAIEKGVRRFVQTATRAGLELRGGPTDDDQYEAERRNAWP